jgi:RimJ/RimL family protein N-acetyltransferase
MDTYKTLNKQIFKSGKHSLVPIRHEDRFKIMKWRNEQMYHLRQDAPISVQDQEKYFSNIISKLFNQKTPNQILFSYLKNNTCIGYGGLVHINWTDKTAEISFLLNTEIEKYRFKSNWSIFLNLIELIAFEELKFHKIYTYAYDIRPKLFEVLDKLKFIKEETLKDQIKIEDKFKDIIIHSKFNKSNY